MNNESHGLSKFDSRVTKFDDKEWSLLKMYLELLDSSFIQVMQQLKTLIAGENSYVSD